MSKVTLGLIDNPELAVFGEHHSIISTLKSKRGLTFSLIEGIAAVSIGVLLLGGAAFGIAAGFNGSMDGDAKSTLASVKTAQTLQQMRTEGYGDLETLTSGEDPALSANADKLKIAATATNYCAVVKSSSMFGANYWLTAKNGKVLEAAPTAAEAGITCPTF